MEYVPVGIESLDGFQNSLMFPRPAGRKHAPIIASFVIL